MNEIEEQLILSILSSTTFEEFQSKVATIWANERIEKDKKDPVEEWWMDA